LDNLKSTFFSGLKWAQEKENQPTEETAENESNKV
jgi:hypothetical protein